MHTVMPEWDKYKRNYCHTCTPRITLIHTANKSLKKLVRLKKIVSVKKLTRSVTFLQSLYILFWFFLPLFFLADLPYHHPQLVFAFFSFFLFRVLNHTFVHFHVIIQDQWSPFAIAIYRYLFVFTYCVLFMHSHKNVL